MQKNKMLLASLILATSISTQSACAPPPKISPYVDINIKQVIGYMFAYLALISNLNNENFFDNANEHKIVQIKKIAKDLGFSEQEIKNLRVKIPKKLSHFARLFRNNYAAFSNTVIIGHQDLKELSKATNDPDVQKFIYAHELSHIKHSHSFKSFLSFAIAPIITHYGVQLFNSLYNSFLKKIQVNRLSRSTRNIVNSVPRTLNSLVPKLIIQMTLWLLIRRRFEKTADLGAATLGPNVTRGGIKFLQSIQEMEDRHEKEILSQYEGSLFKYVINFYLAVKKFMYKTLGSHPSHQARINYLQNTLENRKK